MPGLRGDEQPLEFAGGFRGALYHHFESKDALFEAVLESVEADIARRAADAGRGAADPVDALRAGCLAWVRLAREPTVRQIVLIDAPSVVGWHRWRQIEEEYGLGLVKTALQAVANKGLLSAHLVEPFAHMLLAAMNEIALVTAQAADGAAATPARRGRGRGAAESTAGRPLIAAPR